MKIRNGFVSNSSSSSFIIGIGNSTNDKTGKLFWMDEYGDFTLDDKPLDKWSDVQVSNTDKDDVYKLTIESFTYSEVSCLAKLGDYVTILNSSGPDGDSYFSVYDSNGEWQYYDYDNIDIDDFDLNDQATYDYINSIGGQVNYGAGRNG